MKHSKGNHHHYNVVFRAVVRVQGGRKGERGERTVSTVFGGKFAGRTGEKKGCVHSAVLRQKFE